MNTKVYVDNLATTVTESDLFDLFSRYGIVVNATITMDHSNETPRGFGFVTMVTPEGARAATLALNGKVFRTRPLIASAAWPNEERGRALGERSSTAEGPAVSQTPDSRLM
jgi:RNA recognition motif-containing protein